MNALLVSDEQAALIRQAGQQIELRDAHGNCLGYVVPLVSADDIALARQRLAEPGPRLTTREVLDRLERPARP